MTETIFVLTVMWLDPNGQRPFGGPRRTWGWFPTLELAEKSAMANDGDMYEEGTYNVAVLEEMPWGPLALSIAEHWYAVVAHRGPDGRVEKYEVTKTGKPKALEGLISFGMG